MESLTNYINMSKKNRSNFWEDTLLMMSNSKMNRTNISNMLNSCELSNLQLLSDVLDKKYPNDFLAYKLNKDQYLDKNNKEKIVNQLSEFIDKYVVNI